MIKCPHCGSTAQVKRKGTLTIAPFDENILIENLYCGCGCEWEVMYERNEKGNWDGDSGVIGKIKKTGHIHCPCNGYDCPYWKDGICSLYSKENDWADPWEECSDFGMFWDKYDDYVEYD